MPQPFFWPKIKGSPWAMRSVQLCIANYKTEKNTRYNQMCMQFKT